ncbi:MAG: hypothetical protein ABJK39_04435 [Hyphomicrobiales bacterium]
MTWFSALTGIDVETPQSVNEHLHLDGSYLVSNANQQRFQVGDLSLPNLTTLRQETTQGDSQISVSEIVANVQDLHIAKENTGATFQVASQFNLLEMVSPSVRPEDGVGRYENDRTQGPACAIACGAGTIYRNYFAPIGEKKGQCEGVQIDGLKDIADALKNHENSYWEMKNGYALPTIGGLERLNNVIAHMSRLEIDDLRGLLRIGVHADTEVTLHKAGHNVTQVYCSAMPVSYGRDGSDLWQNIATLVLEAAYEATLLAALQNSIKTGNKRVLLTLLGGGAFGNKSTWIINAILRALDVMKNADLDVFLVSYSAGNTIAEEIIERWSETQNSPFG